MILSKDKSINKVYWEKMDGVELENFVIKIFEYYRANGFPYFTITDKDKLRDFKKFQQYDHKSLLVDNCILQTMHCLGLAWSYFPHAFSIKCNDRLSPMEAFENDELFKKIIRKRLHMGTYISDSGMRKMLKLYTGVQGVSNFRPSAAACIYDKFAPNGDVWDMSGGWGGRMIGAMVSSVNSYIATEPSEKTCIGLNNLAKDFDVNNKCLILQSGSEDYKPAKNSLDLCFTSPPYFNLEKYSEEESQSYVKYPTKKEWVEGFLMETFENCYDGLKPDKYMLINIADIKGKNNIKLESDTIEAAKKIGFKYEGEIYLALSNVNLKQKDIKYKYEPIFKFRK